MSKNKYILEEEERNQSEPGQALLANYKCSAAELKTLKECDRESFFQRSLPLGTGFGLATWWACKNGYIKTNPRLGPGPKALLAISAGYLLGKISYASKCEEKFMKLRNSKLGELLREKKKSVLIHSVTPFYYRIGTGMSMSPFDVSSEHLEEIYPLDSFGDTFEPTASEFWN